MLGKWIKKILNNKTYGREMNGTDSARIKVSRQTLEKTNG